MYNDFRKQPTLVLEGNETLVKASSTPCFSTPDIELIYICFRVSFVLSLSEQIPSYPHY